MSGEKPEYRKRQEDARRERQEAEEHSDRQQIVSALERIAEENKAADYQEKRGDRFHRLVEKLSLRLERRRFWVELAETAGLWVAAAVGVAAIIVSSNDAHKTLGEMQGEQRAWVGPQNGTLESPLVVGTANAVRVSLQNTGHEPARGLIPTLQVGFWHKATETEAKFGEEINGWVSKCRETAPRDGAQILFPTSGFGNGFTFSSEIAAKQIDADLVGGRTVLVVVGCVAYEAYGGPHHTSFCYAYTGGLSKGTELNLCYVGNAAD